MILKMKKFKASGFRSLIRPGWAEFQDMTVFAGENDGGKTAMVDALDIFLTGKAPDDDNYTNLGEDDMMPDTIELEALFELSELEKEIAQKQLPSEISEHVLIVRTIFKERVIGPHMIRTKVHPDKRYNVNFEKLTVSQLTQLANDAQIELPRDIRKPELIKVGTTPGFFLFF